MCACLIKHRLSLNPHIWHIWLHTVSVCYSQADYSRQVSIGGITEALSRKYVQCGIRNQDWRHRRKQRDMFLFKCLCRNKHKNVNRCTYCICPTQKL